jgi:hexosaminidase
VYTLQEKNNWIYLPTALEVQLSGDGKKFTTVGSLDAGAIANAYQAGNPLRISWSDRQARYVTLKASCAPKISEGNPGSGEDAWLFLSELALH